MAKNMNSYKYYVLDVFTNERYKGNPLSVVFTGSDLALFTYKKISKEFGYSETSFIYYSNKDKALKVRSFTPTGFEVNGAGHNLLGAVCAALLGNLNIFNEQEGEQFVIMKDRAIHLSINYIDTNIPIVGMRQKSAIIENVIAPEIIAGTIGIRQDDLSVDDLVPTVVKTEVAHLMVPIKNVEILNEVRPEKTLLSIAAKKYKFQGLYCFTLSNRSSLYFAQARFFNPGIGIDEDAATGSAAGPLAGLLFLKNHINQNNEYQILQGEKINRPSIIRFEVKNDGIWISGSSAVVMEGTIYE